MFTSGRLWAQAPPLGDTFVPYRTWIIGDKWLSQYPPGWPLALAAALAVGIPEWLLNALLGGGSAAALLSRLWRFPNRTFAFAVVGLYLLTPFYLFNAGSYYSHMLPALLVLLLCLTCLAYQRDKKILALVAAGALLGCIGLTRYFTLILLLPALCYWLFAENRGDRVRIVVTMLAAGLPFLGFLMAYQNWVTGSLLRSTYSLITNDDTFVSFTPDHIALGAALTIDRLVELSVWGSPLLIPVYLVCLASKLKRRSIAFYDLIFPAFIVGYVLFADLGGNRYGPRYYFDAYPVMLATVLSAIPREGADSWRRYRRSLAINAVLVSAVYLLTALPFACVAFHRQVEGREEPYRLAAAQNLDLSLIHICHVFEDCLPCRSISIAGGCSPRRISRTASSAFTCNITCGFWPQRTGPTALGRCSACSRPRSAPWHWLAVPRRRRPRSCGSGCPGLHPCVCLLYTSRCV